MINYRGTQVTKDPFKSNTSEEKVETSKSKMSLKSKSKKSKTNVNTIEMKTEWYCHGEDRVADMRKCNVGSGITKNASVYQQKMILSALMAVIRLII